jgi:RHS repeat-associated protein
MNPLVALIAVAVSLGVGSTVDNNGNTLSETRSATFGGGTTTYSWDKDNRLRTVTAPSGVSTFEYDANGIRTKKNESGSETRFLLDGVSVIEEFDASVGATTRYLNNPQRLDEVFLHQTPSGASYPLVDALGSVVALADESGAVSRRYRYDPFGERTDLGGTGPVTARGFSGRWHDSSGLIEHRDRLRSPRQGTWLNEDRWNPRELMTNLDPEWPFGIGVGVTARPPSANRYWVTDARPTDLTDPLGLFSVPGFILGAGIGAAVGAYVGYYACEGSAAVGAAVGAFLGGILGLGLGQWLDLRLIIKILPTFLSMGKFELNVVTSLGRIFGIGWIAGRQAFHWNFGMTGHLMGFAAYALTAIAIALAVGAIALIVMELRMQQAEGAAEE